MHPLVGSLTELSDKELSDKIMDLERKMMMAYRTMPGALQQFNLILEDYQFERQKRLSKELDKMLAQNGQTLDGLIDIK
jgi:hypothetical protein